MILLVLALGALPATTRAIAVESEGQPGAPSHDGLSPLREAAGGDIEFQLTGIPSTWVGFPNGMAQPRKSPTDEVGMEFCGVASNFSYSVVHQDTCYSDHTEDDADNHDLPLSTFDGWVLDLWIQHSGVLWPCVSSSDGGAINLRIKKYDIQQQRYTVMADYVPNSKGQYFFNSTLVLQY